MSKRDGLDSDEKVITYERCNLLRYEKKGSLGSKHGVYSSGELVITQKGIVFIEMTGAFRSSRKRTHSIIYDDIQSISVETRGMTGAVSGGVHLAVAFSSPRGTMRTRFKLHKTKAEKILRAVKRMQKKLKTPGELRSTITRLVKPKGEVSLHDVAKNASLRKLIIQATGVRSGILSEAKAFEKTTAIVESLIADGELDGIVTDDGMYISNTMLARKSVQYQVVIDFTSLFSQLETKGIVLQTIECPSCGGKLDYPESGSVVQCKFCDSTVSAVDLFEKFKSLL
ncbi:MAG: PH domain-containing protein [Candidatus Thorarchaeota archaeon]